MKRIFYFFSLLLALFACSDNDSFTTSRTALLTFGTDTMKMDTVFSNVGSSTYTFWVFNHSGDGIRLNTVRLRGGNQTGFRVNVDGTYLDNNLGSVVTGLEVREGDSLRVFVELTAAETRKENPQEVSDELVFTLESGVEQRVVLRAYAWDAVKMTDLVVSADTLIESSRPVVIYGSGIRVDSGAVLTLRNTTLYFHDGAGMNISGSLKTDHVIMRGDRLDHMFDYLPYDRVSGQWRGICFTRTSSANELVDSEVRNAYSAIILEDSAQLDTITPRLQMIRCVVHNAKGDGIVAFNSHLHLSHCQLTNTLGDCLAVYGGLCTIDHCTLAQFYPYSANRGAALRFADHWADVCYEANRLVCNGSIVTGYADDVVMFAKRDSVRMFEYAFDDCLLRTPAVEDTVNFRHVSWETQKDSVQGKQHFKLIDEKNLVYDFHLDSLSTAQGKGCY